MNQHILELIQSDSLSPIQRSLIGIAIGDALGSQYEFVSLDSVAVDFTYNEHPHMAKGEFITTPAGMYTDDTQMTIANCQALLANAPVESYPEYWLSEFRAVPINGYSRKFQSFLESVTDSEDFLKRMNPIKVTNGGAMRAIPFGYIRDLDTAKNVSRAQAALTHSNGGVSAAVGITHAAHLALYTQTPFSQIGDSVASTHDDSDYVQNWQDLNSFITPKVGVACNGLHTLNAVLYVLSQSNSSQSVLENAIQLGGDTDSVASLALGIYALRHSLADLPSHLVTDFKQTTHGLSYLCELGDALTQKYYSEKT